ncbi:MAG: 1-deoxy-D-xylulose-5-phosphate reductoisomerase [Firmicutes bacterium]|nr:1-deoxy-D-xylulose-5-phosphate reductoisomerase [Bacillota bacterium]
MPNLVILGSTGSIGTQTLDVIRHMPEFKVLGLSAGSNYELLRKQIAEFKPKFACIASCAHAKALREEFSIPVFSGLASMEEMAADPACDLVVVSLVGAMGLQPTLRALEAGKRVALANKETLVAGGHLVMKYREQIVPIDSEHSALWSLFSGRSRDKTEKIILTASGGPFRAYKGSLDEVTVEQALAHPNWNMGGKISIDSATLMNKGLEVIEAHWLFDFSYSAIEVVVHPESIVHSMIQLKDGTILAQLGTADMRLPIQYALTYPEVGPSPVQPLDLVKTGTLSFEAVDWERFPSLRLAYEAGEAGGEKPIALNAANEEAVAGFLAGKLKFTEIPQIVAEVLETFQGKSFPALEQILAIDQEARLKARALLEQRG